MPSKSIAPQPVQANLQNTGELTFRAFDPSTCAYPRAALPVLPKMQFRSIGWSRSNTYPSSFDHTLSAVFVRGRYAIFHALQALGVDKNASVLVPAYHCRTMIDPIAQAGAETVLFPLNPDLSPNMAGLHSAFSSASRPVKAMLLPHYFGFPQDMAPLVDLCAELRIALIEDCSHAYFGSWHGRGLGSWGHCAIGSPSKFFACEDGGTFVLAGKKASVSLRNRDLVDELRSAFHTIEDYWSYRKRFCKGQLLSDLGTAFERLKSDQAGHFDEVISDAGVNPVSHHFDPNLSRISASRCSRLIMRMSNIEWLCERRRSNFLTLLEGIRTVPHCRPLFSELPAGVVPYMFPLLIDQPEYRFHWLKNMGVPMYRWDELAVSDCLISADYRLRLVHLPCHQTMSGSDLHWLLSALSHAMRTPVKCRD